MGFRLRTAGTWKAGAEFVTPWYDQVSLVRLDGFEQRRINVSFEQILKALPSLSNPYALAGYLVVAIIWLAYFLSKARVFSRLSAGQTSGVVRFILRRAFQLSVVVVVLGFGYAAYRAHLGVMQNAKTHTSVKQQAGDCSNIQNGNNNVVSSDCENKAAGTK